MNKRFFVTLAPTVLAGLLLATACSESDPKALTNRGANAINSGDWKGGLADYEAALAHMDASNAEYLRASVGRCQALARLDPKKGKSEFLALAKAQAKLIQPQDFHVVVSQFLSANNFIDAIDVMRSGKEMFPESPKMKSIEEYVVAESRKALDPAVSDKLKSLGYL